MTTPAQLAGVIRNLTSRDIIVHQYRCVRVRNRHAACSKCAEACTSGCISFKDGEILVDHDKCLGCGTCCTVCPTCALEAANPNDAVLLRDARRVLRASGDSVVFASQDMLDRSTCTFDPSRVVAVVNLGRIEETLLVRLALAGGIHLMLVAPTDAAEEHRVGARTASMVCESANAILSAWGSVARATIVDTLPHEVLLDNPDTAQEEGSTIIGAHSEAASSFETATNSYAPSVSAEMNTRPAAATPTQTNAPDDHGDAAMAPKIAATGAYHRIRVMKDGTLPHFMPDRREELLDALFQMGAPVARTVSSRLWGHVVIDPERCTGCRACATFCPTGALFKYLDDDGATGIEHAPGDCVKCMSCRDVCRAGAITIEDEVVCRDILSGAAERFPMPPEELFRSNPHSIFNALKPTFKIDGVFER